MIVMKRMLGGLLIGWIYNHSINKQLNDLNNNFNPYSGASILVFIYIYIYSLID